MSLRKWTQNPESGDSSKFPISSIDFFFQKGEGLQTGRAGANHFQRHHILAGWQVLLVSDMTNHSNCNFEQHTSGKLIWGTPGNERKPIITVSGIKSERAGNFRPKSPYELSFFKTAVVSYVSSIFQAWKKSRENVFVSQMLLFITVRIGWRCRRSIRLFENKSKYVWVSGGACFGASTEIPFHRKNFTCFVQIFKFT